jgi:hypothetical protein
MKNLSQKSQDEIIAGIINSDISSKIAQGIAAYLKEAFAKLPANEVQEEIKNEPAN